MTRDLAVEVLSERAPWWAPPRLNEALTHRLHVEALRRIGEADDVAATVLYAIAAARRKTS